MRHAVLIASATFDSDSGIEPLRFPANDVSVLHDLFRTDDFKFEQITPIIDQPRQFVVDKLDEILSESAFEDFLLIYFSGHGKLNAKGDLFLSCRNTKEKSLNGTGLKYSHLMDMLDAHQADRVAILLDCCYAGRAVSGFRGAASEQVSSQLDSGRGIFVLGASGATQTAEEREQDGHGIFTRQVIDGLRTGAADVDDDGQISLNDLAKYVRDEFRRKNVQQDPFVAGLSKSGDLILGTNRRQKHKKMLALITTKLELSKGYFSRATYRAIEDYLDDIAGKPEAGQDPRLEALAAFESGGPVETVIDAFRRKPKLDVNTDNSVGDSPKIAISTDATSRPSLMRPVDPRVFAGLTYPEPPISAAVFTERLASNQPAVQAKTSPLLGQDNFIVMHVVATLISVGLGIICLIIANSRTDVSDHNFWTFVGASCFIWMCVIIFYFVKGLAERSRKKMDPS